MKNARHQKILELIEESSIDKQEELLRQLHQAGFNVTQATVSRDIRELHLVKTSTGNGGYRYVSSYSREQASHSPNRFEMIFKETAVKVDYAGNTVLVQCYSGMANAACELFDSMVWEDVVGSLSGDDTFIVLMRNEAAAENICKQLQQYVTRK